MRTHSSRHYQPLFLCPCSVTPTALRRVPRTHPNNPHERIAGDTTREASSGEVKDLRHEMSALKEAVADLTLENRLLKKA